jgi:hypothetical protein
MTALTLDGHLGMKVELDLSLSCPGDRFDHRKACGCRPARRFAFFA